MITNFAKSANNRVAQNDDPSIWQEDIQTGFGANASAMASQTWRERLSISGVMAELRSDPGVEHYESVASVGRRMLREGTLTKEEVASFLVVPDDWEDSDPYYDWDKVGEYIRARDPEAKLDLRSERLVRRNEVFDKLRAGEQAITSAATGPGKVGQFAGAMPAYMADPPNLVAMGISPWSIAAKTMGRTAQYATLMAEQAVVEGVTAISVAEHQKALGLEYGSKEIATDISMSVLGAGVLKGVFDVGAAITKRVKVLKASPAVETVTGQKAIRNLQDAADEVELSRQAGEPLDEVLDATDNLLKEFETSERVKDINDEMEFPEVRDYEQDQVLSSDLDASLAQKSDDMIPVGVKEVEGKIEIEYKSRKEVLTSFDDELEKTYKMRVCFGL